MSYIRAYFIGADTQRKSVARQHKKWPKADTWLPHSVINHNRTNVAGASNSLRDRVRNAAVCSLPTPMPPCVQHRCMTRALSNGINVSCQSVLRERTGKPAGPFLVAGVVLSSVSSRGSWRPLATPKPTPVRWETLECVLRYLSTVPAKG